MAPKRKAGQATKKEEGSTELQRLGAQYPGFTFRAPEEGETFLSYKEGELCILWSHLKAGLALPLPPYLTVLLRHCHMVPAQLTPNAIEILRGVSKFMEAWNVRWTVPNILSLLKVASQEKGVHFVHPRQPSKLVLSGTPKGLHGWKDKIFFVKSERPWGINTVPKEIDLKALQQVDITAEVEQFHKDIGCAYFDLNVRTLAVVSFCEPRMIGKKASGVQKEKLEAPIATAGEEEEATPLRKTRATPRVAEKKRRKLVVSEEEAEPEAGGEEKGETGEREKTGEVPSPSSSGEEAALGSRVEAPSERETEGEESASAEYWEDAKSQTFTFRSNLMEGLIPQGEAPEMPVRLLTALLSSQDEAYLDSLADPGLAALQGQLAIGSALVAKYISDGSRHRLVGLREGKKEIEELKIEKAGLEEKADETELAFAAQKNSLLIENRQLAEEALSWEEKYRAASQEREAEKEKRLQEVKALEGKMAAQEEKAKKSLQGHHAEIAMLKEEIEKLKAGASSSTPSMTVKEASALYKLTEDFKIEMGGFGDMGFQMLKEALLKDGVAKEEALNAYNYLDTLVRVKRGEL